MNVKASNLQINTLQQGMKLTVYIDRHEVEEALKGIENLINSPLKMALKLDKAQKEKELTKISERDRKIIDKITKKFASKYDQGLSEMRAVLMDRFAQDSSNKWGRAFSLESCSKELAEDFIAWLYDQSFQEEVDFILPDSPDLTVV